MYCHVEVYLHTHMCNHVVDGGCCSCCCCCCCCCCNKTSGNCALSCCPKGSLMESSSQLLSHRMGFFTSSSDGPQSSALNLCHRTEVTIITGLLLHRPTYVKHLTLQIHHPPPALWFAVDSCRLSFTPHIITLSPIHINY